VLTLLVASVLTFQSRHVFEEFNESHGLAFMIYSHTIFLLLRLGVLSLVNSHIIPQDLMHPILSLFTSLDVIFAVSFYFGQKFLPIMKDTRSQSRTRSRNSKQRSANNIEEANEDEDEDEDDFDESRATLAPENQFSIRVPEFDGNAISAISR